MSAHVDDSNFIRHEPCPSCGSKDNLARYDDGHAFCFGCSYHEKSPSIPSLKVVQSDQPKDLVSGEPITRSIRAITPETFRFWDYKTGSYKGEPVHIANHYRFGRVVGQKLRTRSKTFNIRGKLEPLYGMWLWGATNAKRVVVTEGELDALSVSQVQNNRWPVVSVPNGATAAAKSFAAASEWLSGFSEVVIMFDTDDAGCQAAIECAKVLPPGKAKIATLPGKDANDLLVQGREEEILKAIYHAEAFRPDGIVQLSEVIEQALQPPEYGTSLPWPIFTELTYGKRTGEWWCFGAGVGVGKTDVFTQMMAHDIAGNNLKIGGIFLEQPVAETAKRLAGKIDQKLYHIPDADYDPEELRSTLNVISDRVYLYNHFGSQDWDTIRELIRHMRYAYDIRHFYLDHLTALAAHAQDERRYLDGLCADLSSLCQELDIHVDVISHLSTPQGEAHEEGARVKEKHFTGSRAIARWAHYMIGLERDKQAEDESERHCTTIRILKDRYTGRATGKTFVLKYNQKTGHLTTSDAESPITESDMEDIGF